MILKMIRGWPWVTYRSEHKSVQNCYLCTSRWRDLLQYVGMCGNILLQFCVWLCVCMWVCSGFACLMVVPIGRSLPTRCWNWRFLRTRFVVGNPETAVAHRVTPSHVCRGGWGFCVVSDGRNPANPNVWSSLYLLSSAKAVIPYRLRIHLLPTWLRQHNPPIQHHFIPLQSVPSIIILYSTSPLALDFCHLDYRLLLRKRTVNCLKLEICEK
jgi:hypothetical protein